MAKIKHIAVNTRFLLKGGLEGMGRFTFEIVKRLVQNHPEVRFSFLFDRPFDPKYIFADNVTPFKLFPPARHPILFYLYFDWAVTWKLRQLKPDLFFSPDGYLSRRTKIPQVPVFHDLAFMHFPEDVKKFEAWHYHNFFPKFSEKAAKIIAVSEYTRQDINKQFGRSLEDISVVYNACAEHFKPSDESEKQATRAKFSDGKPYLHFVGAIHPRKNLNTLILAYNHFKQKTGLPHKLLIIGRKAWNFEEVIHEYGQSPFKNDILFTGFVSDEELSQLYGASEALCYVPYFEGFGIPIIEAMQTETAVVCSNVTSMPEVAGDAALLVDPYKPVEIGEAIVKLITQPDLRADLIQKGRSRREKFSWDHSAEKAWEVFESIV